MVYSGAVRFIGEIALIHADGTFFIRPSHGLMRNFHRKQIRRLVKKEKREPLECWVNEYPSGIGGSIIHVTEMDADMDATSQRLRAVHMREVIK